MSLSARVGKWIACCLLSMGVSLTAVANASVPIVVAAVAGLPDFTELVEKAGPAVVNIRTTERVRPGSNEPGEDNEEMQDFLRRYFGIPGPRQQQPQSPHSRKAQPQQAQPEEEVSRGIGSGFIVSSDGFIMTNAHVVDGADEVYVTLTDKREFKAKIVGADQRSDVAVIKIDGNNLPKITIGSSDKIKVGEWVIAIGSPFGLDNTVTAGIISAKARDTGDIQPLIQTDVSINPGNSGGPLINMRGEVVGINSQIFSRSGGYMGISFAVPIDDAMRVAEQLKSSGKVSRGRIGIQIGEVSKDVSESLGLAKGGAEVVRVEPGSPAEKGGIEAGDIILKFNGNAIEKPAELTRFAGGTKPGSKVTVTVWRKGSTRDINLILGELEVDRAVRKPESKKSKAELVPNSLGINASDLNDAQKKDLQVDRGIVVETVEGPAARAGIRPGDIVLRLNDTDILSVKQFNNLVKELDVKKLAAILIRRGEASQFLTVRPVAQ